MTALILGGAATLFDDLRGFAQWRSHVDLTVAVNDAGWIVTEPIDHWVTLHWEHMLDWKRRRRWRVWPREDDAFETWCRPSPKLEAYAIQPDHTLGHWGPGSSGLYAVTVARHLGAERIVLCGVPMTPTPHVSRGEDWPQHEIDVHRPGWEYHHERIRDYVRSMSGWTRELLGAPTEGWLNG